MAMAESTISLPGVPPHVQELLLWRDWKKSAAVLGSVIVGWFFLGSPFSPLSFWQLLSILVGVAVPVFFTWNHAAPFLKREGPPVPAFLTQGVTKQDLDSLSEPAIKILNPVIGVVGTLVAGKDIRLSGMVTVGALVAFKVFGYVSLLTLAFLLTLLAFTLPKLYELKKHDINKVAGIVSRKARELYQDVEKVVLKKAKPAYNAAEKAAHAAAVKTE